MQLSDPIKRNICFVWLLCVQRRRLPRLARGHYRTRFGGEAGEGQDTIGDGRASPEQTVSAIPADGNKFGHYLVAGISGL